MAACLQAESASAGWRSFFSAILRRVVPIPLAPRLYADHFEARGVDLFRVVCESDLEGIVAKQKNGLYTPEETSWVKIKNPRYSQIEGRHELFEKRAAGA